MLKTNKTNKKNYAEKKSAGGRSAYDEALDFLTPRARTVREMQEHLDEKNYSEAEIDAVIERLEGNGLLNDEKFACDFIESRLNTKPVSRRKLREQLEGHKVGGEALENALSAITDETELDNARSVAAKFFRQFEGLDDEERFRRVGLRLAGRGYSYDDIKTVLSELAHDE